MTRLPILTPRQINARRKREGKPPLNFKLIRKIIKKIETTPEAYDQSVWGKKEPSAPCGTAACIAGWACYFGEKKTLKQLWRDPESAATIGAKLIGLDKGDYWTDNPDEYGMFNGFADSWPEPFSSRFHNARGPKGQAKAAVAYLKHVLRTGQIVE